MPRKYSEIADLAGRVVKAREMRAEASADSAKLAALKSRGADELIAAGVFISREEVQDALLFAGVIAVAAGIENTRMIGGAISPIGDDGDGLSVITENHEIAGRYGLPAGKYYPVGTLLLNLAKQDPLPPMTADESKIQQKIMGALDNLEALKPELRRSDRDFFP